jgi:hypothetical protein
VSMSMTCTRGSSQLAASNGYFLLWPRDAVAKRAYIADHWDFHSGVEVLSELVDYSGPSRIWKNGGAGLTDFWSQQ